MLRISVKDNIAQVVRDMGIEAKRYNNAAALALSETAVLAKQEIVRDMSRVFDRPTPWTLKSMNVKRASAGRLTATVYLKGESAGSGTPAEKYLTPQIDGGMRPQKRFEIALQRSGVLPAGWRAVPGARAKIDAYGNMDRGQIVQILSYFKSFDKAGYSANITDKRKARLAKGTKKKHGMEYVVMAPGRGRAGYGIYKRTAFGAWGSAIEPIMIFVKSARYTRRLPFYDIIKRSFKTNFNREMRRALLQVGKTGTKLDYAWQRS